MPYLHRDCMGEIGLLSRRCKKCGKRWPIKYLFTPSPPDDMFFYIKPKEIKRGSTSYAKWADKYPAVGDMASRLPNWPRWTRLLVASVSILIIVFLVLKLTGRV